MPVEATKRHMMCRYTGNHDGPKHGNQWKTKANLSGPGLDKRNFHCYRVTVENLNFDQKSTRNHFLKS